jgi:hypothetical protein
VAVLFIREDPKKIEEGDGYVYVFRFHLACIFVLFFAGMAHRRGIFIYAVMFTGAHKS